MFLIESVDCLPSQTTWYSRMLLIFWKSVGYFHLVLGLCIHFFKRSNDLLKNGLGLRRYLYHYQCKGIHEGRSKYNQLQPTLQQLCWTFGFDWLVRIFSFIENMLSLSTSVFHENLILNVQPKIFATEQSILERNPICIRSKTFYTAVNTGWGSGKIEVWGFGQS